MWFPKSSLKSITQLHSPTQEGAEISRERPRCCCIPLASPWIVPSTPGWGEAHRAQALHLRWLRCSPVLWAVGQHCPRARISFSTAAEELRALHKASRATQAAQTAALGVAELGQTLHLEPLCSPCPAPPAQGYSGESLLGTAWSQLTPTAAASVPQPLPHTAVGTQTAMKTPAECQ